jgi:hypothetical protein
VYQEAKKRKIDCGALNVGGDAIVENDLTVWHNLTVDGTISGGSIVPALVLPNGTAADPALAFSSSTSSGYYWDTAGTAGQAWSANGTKRMKLNSSQLEMSVPVQLPNGTHSAPSLSFAGSTNSGLDYGVNGVSIDSGGVLCAQFGNALGGTPGIYAPHVQVFQNAASYGLSYTNAGSNSTLNLDTAGVPRLRVGLNSATGIIADYPVTTGTNSLTTSDLTASTSRVTSTYPTVGYQMANSQSGLVSNTSGTLEQLMTYVQGQKIMECDRESVSQAQGGSLYGDWSCQAGAGGSTVGTLSTDYCRLLQDGTNTKPSLAFNSQTNSGLSLTHVGQLLL